jgi:hypothetical protein
MIERKVAGLVMPCRSTIALLLANILPVYISYAQQPPCPPVSTEQVISDVVVSGASVNDGYGGWTTCGMDGQVYRHPGSGHLRSIQRVSPNGSTLIFSLPDNVWPAAMAPAGTGLNILASNFSRTEGRVYEMYHFNSQASLLTFRRVHMTFAPERMAVTSSGKTVVLGHYPDDFSKREEWKYGGAVLDADDQLTRGFDLPLPPGGGGWTFASEMLGGNEAAYVMLKSITTPDGMLTAIATISETGNDILKIRVISVPPDCGQRHHNQWLFGPHVAVEVYHDPSERPHPVDRFDEYDLTTGDKVATKTAPGTGFQSGCYSGNEFSMLAHSAHVDPARHLSPDTLRLVTSELKRSN